jgi:hypothetical protein
MASRKQRRRRAKDRRHDWEYVYVDEAGEEVPVEEAEAPRSGKRGAEPKPVVHRGRTVEPPSWNRVFKRTLIFGPLILVMVYLLRPKDSTTTSVILNAALLLAFFIPFSYVMDSFMYRSFRKRMAKRESTRGKRT